MPRLEVRLKNAFYNIAWERVTLHAGKSPVGCCWVFTVKIGLDGLVDRPKARSVNCKGVHLDLWFRLL